MRLGPARFLSFAHLALLLASMGAAGAEPTDTTTTEFQRLSLQVDELSLPIKNIYKLEKIPLVLDPGQSDYMKLRYSLQNFQTTLIESSHAHCNRDGGVSGSIDLDLGQLQIDLFRVQKRVSTSDLWGIPSEIRIPLLSDAAVKMFYSDALEAVPTGAVSFSEIREALKNKKLALAKQIEERGINAKLARQIKEHGIFGKYSSIGIWSGLVANPRDSDSLTKADDTAMEVAANIRGDALSQDQYTGADAKLALSLLLRKAKTEADISSAYRQVAPHWSAEEKLKYVQDLGWLMLSHYDESPLSSKHTSSRLDIFNAIFNGTNSGVCRHIASAQGQVLQDLGFKNVRIQTENTEVGHAVVFAQDPSNPKKIYKFNYYERQDVDLTRSDSPLLQTNDISTSYYLNKPEAGTSAHILTERGALLETQTGGQATDLEPFWQNKNPFTGSMTAVRKGKGGTFFTGILSDGTPIAGVAGSQSFGDRDATGWHHEHGVSFSLEKPLPEQGLDTVHLYLRQRTGNNWEVLSNSNTKVWITSSVNAYYDKTFMAGPVRPDRFGFDEGIFGMAGVKTQFQSDDKKTQATAKVASQAAVGLKDVRKIIVFDNLTVFHNLSFASLEGTHEVAPGLELLLNLAAGVREMGPQAQMEVGLTNTDKTWLVKSLYQGALSSESLAVAPGMKREVSVAVEKKVDAQKDNLPKWLTNLDGTSIQFQIFAPTEAQDLSSIRATTKFEKKFK